MYMAELVGASVDEAVLQGTPLTKDYGKVGKAAHSVFLRHCGDTLLTSWPLRNGRNWECLSMWNLPWGFAFIILILF